MAKSHEKTAGHGILEQRRAKKTARGVGSEEVIGETRTRAGLRGEKITYVKNHRQALPGEDLLDVNVEGVEDELKDTERHSKGHFRRRKI